MPQIQITPKKKLTPDAPIWNEIESVAQYIKARGVAPSTRHLVIDLDRFKGQLKARYRNPSFAVLRRVRALLAELDLENEICANIAFRKPVPPKRSAQPRSLGSVYLTVIAKKSSSPLCLHNVPLQRSEK
jgi:hypothetical protein